MHRLYRGQFGNIIIFFLICARCGLLSAKSIPTQFIIYKYRIGMALAACAASIYCIFFLLKKNFRPPRNRLKCSLSHDLSSELFRFYYYILNIEAESDSTFLNGPSFVRISGRRFLGGREPHRFPRTLRERGYKKSTDLLGLLTQVTASGYINRFSIYMGIKKVRAGKHGLNKG